MEDAIVLSYKDTVLRNSDLDKLRGECQLTNEIIGFYFQYLASEFPCDDIVLVPPTLSYLLANAESPENAKVIIEPLRLCEKKIVVFAVNRCFNREVGETVIPHWSTLVYNRGKNKFIHHDSVRTINIDDAFKLYEVVKGFVSADNIPDFMESKSTPQLGNRYDCGMYVLAIVRTICFWYLRKYQESPGPSWFSVIKMHVTASSVERNMRSQVLRVIEDLRMRLSK